MPSHSNPSGRRNAAIRAFTLIELLTVIAIIGILAAILIPTVGKVRQTAKTSRCASNLRQISQAMILLVDDSKGRFPDGPGWDVKVGPYLNLGAILSQPAGTRAAADIFTCPNDTEPRTSEGGYAPNARSYICSARDATKPGLGIFSRLNPTQAADPANAYRYSRRLGDMPAPGRTIMLAEKYSDNNGNPVNNLQFYGNGDLSTGWQGAAATPKKVGTTNEYYHGSAQNYSFADGHIEYLTPLQTSQNNKPFSSGGRWQATEN